MAQFQARVLVAGETSGEILRLAEPLSLWGGLNPETGEIIDKRHPNVGQIVTNKILVLPAGRGSSSASSILLEAVRVGTAPVAIITAEVDGILALGTAVSHEMYNHAPAMLVLPYPDYDLLHTGQWGHISYNGIINLA